MTALRAAIGLLLVTSAVCSAAEDPHEPTAEKPTCSALERVEPYDDYNRLTCQGIARMEQRAYAEAASLFEQALAIDFFEMPNYQLLPRLALAHFRAGDPVRARVDLETAKLSLDVLTGVADCVETDKWSEIVDVATAKRIDSPQHDAVVLRMCGAAREATGLTEKGWRETAALIRYFGEVKAEIETAAPKSTAAGTSTEPCPCAHEDAMLSFGPVVELRGVLKTEVMPNPDPERSDTHDVTVLVLTKPISVRGNPLDELNAETVTAVEKLQVYIVDYSECYGEYESMLGKLVAARGTLESRMTGNQFTPVLLTVRMLVPLQGDPDRDVRAWFKSPMHYCTRAK